MKNYKAIQKLIGMLDNIQVEIKQLKKDKFPTSFEEGQEYLLKKLLSDLGVNIK